MSLYTYVLLGLCLAVDMLHFAAKNFTSSGEALMCVSLAGLIVLVLLVKHSIDRSKQD